MSEESLELLCFSQQLEGARFNGSCQMNPTACQLCYRVQRIWRVHQFHLYQLTAVLSMLTNLLIVTVMLYKGVTFACHLQTVVMAAADAIHSFCLAVITQLIMAGGITGPHSNCWCKVLYYIYFLTKALSNWTMLTLSVGLWLSLSRPFRAFQVQKVSFGAALSLAQAVLLMSAMSPRLAYVEAPNGATDRANALCHVRRLAPGFRCYATLETFALALVLPVAANLAVGLVCARQLRRHSCSASRSRAVLAAGLAHAALHAPYAAVLAAMQLGSQERPLGYYLSLCLYYAATAWFSLSCASNFLAYVVFNRAFRLALAHLLLLAPRLLRVRIRRCQSDSQAPLTVCALG